MATVTMTSAGVAGCYPSRNGNVKVPYLVEYELDFADAATEKGSALAATDVIETIQIPAGTVVLFAGFEVKSVATGESADTAVTLGDGVDPNRWVDTFDLDAAAAGAHGTIVIATANPTVFAAADTIDVVISAATTAPTGGTLRIYAMMVDVNDAPNTAGIALVGS